MSADIKELVSVIHNTDDVHFVEITSWISARLVPVNNSQNLQLASSLGGPHENIIIPAQDFEVLGKFFTEAAKRYLAWQKTQIETN